jgi:2-amino-4-hydroxy-6-hydroxymethyldihydropteridine diphosphokinase
VPTAYLALGSNLADRRQLLADALDALARHPKNRLTGVSSVYETRAVCLPGQDAQPDFLNLVARVETDLSPLALLDLCLATEQQLGRVRRERWGPRTVDLDVLLHGDTILHDDRLTLPHPRMKERAFVLVPLADLAPDLLLDGEPVAHHLARVDQTDIRRTDIPLLPAS